MRNLWQELWPIVQDQQFWQLKANTELKGFTVFSDVLLDISITSGHFEYASTIQSETYCVGMGLKNLCGYIANVYQARSRGAWVIWQVHFSLNNTEEKPVLTYQYHHPLQATRNNFSLYCLHPGDPTMFFMKLFLH